MGILLSVFSDIQLVWVRALLVVNAMTILFSLNLLLLLILFRYLRYTLNSALFFHFYLFMAMIFLPSKLWTLHPSSINSLVLILASSIKIINGHLSKIFLPVLTHHLIFPYILLFAITQWILLSTILKITKFGCAQIVSKFIYSFCMLPWRTYKLFVILVWVWVLIFMRIVSLAFYFTIFIFFIWNQCFFIFLEFYTLDFNSLLLDVSLVLFSLWCRVYFYFLCSCWVLSEII